jgi:hypothetical protein
MIKGRAVVQGVEVLLRNIYALENARTNRREGLLPIDHLSPMVKTMHTPNEAIEMTVLSRIVASDSAT